MGRGAVIERWQGIGLILACMALGLQLVIPQGFMPGLSADGRAALVICTAGPGDAPGKTDREHGGQSGADQTVCAFAVHSDAPAPEFFSQHVATEALYAPPTLARLRDQAPGRGLPAPPPPSRGPPLQTA